MSARLTGSEPDPVWLGEQLQALLDPVLAVLERLLGIFVDPTEKRPAHAALDAVEDAGAPTGAGWA